MDIIKMDKERAVENLAHQIAGAVHLMLARAHMTVADLKSALVAISSDGPELIDDLLAAKNPHTIHCRFLADVAFVLGGEWDVNIRKIVEQEIGLAEQAPG